MKACDRFGLQTGRGVEHWGAMGGWRRGCELSSSGSRRERWLLGRFLEAPGQRSLDKSNPRLPCPLNLEKLGGILLQNEGVLRIRCQILYSHAETLPHPHSHGRFHAVTMVMYRDVCIPEDKD